MIRKAKLEDAEAIKHLIEEGAKDGEVLPRSLNEIYENLRDFWVCEFEGKVVGCCALHIVWSDLAEVKSLSVSAPYRGRGFGRELVEACINEAREMGIPKIFVLTDIPDFFEKIGFEGIDKAGLPHKIWGECVRCVKFPDCPAVALLYRL